MEDNKYYTPDIEDIRVGYECERKLCNTETCEYKAYMFIYVPPKDLFHKQFFRVSYLTKEQIEAENKYENIRSIDDSGAFEADISRHGYTYRLCWSSDKILQVWEDGLNYLDVIFRGDCPSINEFRYIIKLLGI